MHGNRYAIVECPYCKASIYQRHLRLHIERFHLDEVNNPQANVVPEAEIAGQNPGEPIYPKRRSVPFQPTDVPQELEASLVEPPQPVAQTPVVEVEAALLIVMNDARPLAQDTVIIDSNEMLLAMTLGGMPCSSKELKARFSAFLAEQLRNADSDTIRIHIDW